MNEHTVFVRMCQPNTAHLVGKCETLNIKLFKEASATVCFCDTDGCNTATISRSTHSTSFLILVYMVTYLLI